MYPDEKIYLTKTIFTEALIESSSDFIVKLYQLAAMIDDKPLRLHINSIYKWEYDNFHTNWIKNVSFINDKMIGLSPFDYDEIFDAYTAILSYFINDETVSKLYKMDGSDTIGWQIYRELEEKRRSANYLKNIALHRGIT